MPGVSAFPDGVLMSRRLKDWMNCVGTTVLQRAQRQREGSVTVRNRTHLVCIVAPEIRQRDRRGHSHRWMPGPALRGKRP